MPFNSACVLDHGAENAFSGKLVHILKNCCLDRSDLFVLEEWYERWLCVSCCTRKLFLMFLSILINVVRFS